MRRFLLLIVFVLAACGDQPAPDLSAVEPLWMNDFNPGAPWDGPHTDLLNIDHNTDAGALRLHTDGLPYAWVLNTQTHTDVTLEVDTHLRTNSPNRGYGVACRADENGNGYYFLVSRDGYAAILLATPQVVRPLVDWDKHEAVETGLGAANTVRASCKGSSLELAINGFQIASVEDATHSEGSTALIVSGGDLGGSTVEVSEVRAYAAD